MTNLKEIRKNQHLTIKELSHKANVSKMTIYNAEHKKVMYSTFFKIGFALGLDYDEIQKLYKKC